jgi:hypothetical protein
VPSLNQHQICSFGSHKRDTVSSMARLCVYPIFAFVQKSRTKYIFVCVGLFLKENLEIQTQSLMANICGKCFTS